ncbi:tRNA A64-2'-O-ribosylphosphate transferase [Arachnomyces sp. PD_36]|nr:tRNA A64-2'-O-ribosylphosphate transferase [Arachnomyces sp. PD_36]
MVLSSNNIFQDYRPIYEQWIAQAQAIAIVYSITDRKSFEDIREHRDMLRETREKKGQDVDIPIVIVGNKADKETERAVSKAEGENLAKEFGYPFFEVSAKENATVNEPVEELVRGYRRRQQKKDRERAARIEERKKQEEKDERKNTGCLRGKRCVVM